jgi:uncharacterized protein
MMCVTKSISVLLLAIKSGLLLLQNHFCALMHIRLFLLLFSFVGGFLTSVSAKQIYTPQTVPNPKQERSTNAISDPDTILTSAQAWHLNAMLTEIEDSTTVQVALVILKSIGEADPNQFAYQLFNEWGIGYQDKNNGLLILLVIDQRAWRIETGYGLEGVLPDALLKRIATEQMLPFFRDGYYAYGLMGGVTAIKDILLKPTHQPEIYSEAGEMSLQDSNLNPPRYQLMWYLLLAALCLLLATVWMHHRKKIDDRTTLLLIFFSIEVSIFYIFLVKVFDCAALLYPGTAFFVYLYLQACFLVLCLLLKRNSAILSTKRDALLRYQEMASAHRSWKLALLILLFLPLAVYFIWYFVWLQKQKKRFAPRTGSNTGKPLRRLSESEEDRFLKKEQLLEEKLYSVDYDVWVSDDFKDIEILEYVRNASGYSPCPQCGVRSLFYTNKVIQAATTSSSGRGLKIYSCKNCRHKKEEVYTIPQKSSSSSSSGSSSSGRSSGGSSWGGGSSGGGGAGGRW